MNIIDILLQQFGQKESQAIAKQVGAEPTQVGSVIKQFLPLITKGLANNASKPEGRMSLFNAVERDHDGSILDSAINLLFSDQNSNNGAKILGHIFGSKTGSIAGYLGKTSGVGTDKASQIIQILAPIVMGQLGRQTKAAGLGSDGLASMLLNSANEVAETDPKNMNIISRLIDQDGDGNTIDDLASMGVSLLSNWMNGRPTRT